MFVFHDAGQGRSHEGFPKAYHIPNQYPAALVQVMRGDFDRSRLELK